MRGAVAMLGVLAGSCLLGRIRIKMKIRVSMIIMILIKMIESTHPLPSR